MIKLAVPTEIGTVLKLDDQEYELSRFEPYTRDDGRQSTLLVWETTCPSCAEAFLVKSTLTVRWLVRRCVDCAKPGKPVQGKRGRNVKVVVFYA